MGLGPQREHSSSERNRPLVKKEVVGHRRGETHLQPLGKKPDTWSKKQQAMGQMKKKNCKWRRQT
jgi:hypothetical protein